FHYMHAPTRLWGTWTVNHAVLARLLWDPATPVDTLLDDLRRNLYPTTTARVTAFHAALERASENILAIEHAVGAFGYTGAPSGRLTVPGVPLFPLQHLHAEPDPDTNPPRANAAPAWSQITRAMVEARAALDGALP